MKKLLLFLLAVSGITAIHAQQSPAADSLQEYTGKYKFPEGSVVTEVTVSIENGGLFAVSVMGSSELKRIEKDLFEVVAYAGRAIFKRNEESKLTGVRIEVEDLILEGTKEISAVQFLHSRLTCIQ